MNTIIVTIAVSALLILASIIITWKVAKVINDLEAGKTALEARISTLEGKLDTNPQKRHTMSTVAGLEDATAVIIDIQARMRAYQERLDTVRQILGQVRQGPAAYSTEREAGRRPENFDN